MPTSQKPKGKVLIANRGEIAVRVIKSCAKLGLSSIAIYSAVDALAPHVKLATESVCLGDDPKDYTNIVKIVKIAVKYRATAVHPGYGFLSENPEFCDAISKKGIMWLGPDSETMTKFALKHEARRLAVQAEVPVIPGSELLESAEQATEWAKKIGYPVLIKATGGGGGMGIYVCRSDEEVAKNFVTAQKQGETFFGNKDVFLEKYVEKGRHIEVQVFGDGKGDVLAFAERECSIQRRHQKILEESPSPFVNNDEMRQRLKTAATNLCSLAHYRSAGTVEFLVDSDTTEFYFLEVNTRLQVEHGITEMIHGNIDIVALQLKLSVPSLKSTFAADFAKIKENSVGFNGWAIEVRICAEDPLKDFVPSPGTLGEVEFPAEDEHLRIDTWISRGTEVSPYFDSLLGKLMVWGASRAKAIKKLEDALHKTKIKGTPTNLQFLKHLIQDERFLKGDFTTRFLDTYSFNAEAMEIITPGMQTSVQDWPGRIKLWHVGVPPSGPMDAFSFRIANALVGNPSNAAGLEFVISGPTIKFYHDAWIAITGAKFESKIDGKKVPLWQAVKVAAGQTISVGSIEDNIGVRGYLAVAGGIDVPDYLGSKSTFPSGNFGGYQGRILRAGDSLEIGECTWEVQPNKIPMEWFPKYANLGKTLEGDHDWEVGVLPGPHADPDYMTSNDIVTFYSSTYKVHYNSNRLGIRLSGPKPEWARPDGGEGGSHPSNVHDHVYAIGTVNFTGDMPIVLAQDGPSLGGFVCPATIISSELWKMGQVRPNEGIRFVKLTIEQAYIARLKQDYIIDVVHKLAIGKITGVSAGSIILKDYAPAVPPELAKVPTQALLIKKEAEGSYPGIEVRLAGDRYVMVEYGPMELDLNIRVRVYALEKWLEANSVEGLVETSPGVRSCMIEYDQVKLPLPKLLELIQAADSALGSSEDMVLDTRVLYLPMAFHEQWTKDAITKYMKSVRPEAPYLPDNIEYMAANNGIKARNPIKAVRNIIFSASYMVLGLGDVYLGAPCAVPVNPLHRLVTSKYNPARTFTHEGTVGIGGSYMCIYPMNSPGGYQLVGRSLPIWNTFATAGPFSPKKPWLLEIFDQVRFFHVSEDKLLQLREGFRNGTYDIKIVNEKFSMRKYNNMIKRMSKRIAKNKQIVKEAMAKQLQLEAESLARLQATQNSEENTKLQMGRGGQVFQQGKVRTLTA
eukprot:TRINITY_DN1830_c0_g1_i6.p1 TRINITY_DN1830_c0_g1~~TRINITY_DN1830_c0_g1_i6.p1  ORF type:complete len:1188 (-),score=148.95 TRINITY_DN1830_c0_g1_i6:1676-5239(-)